MSWVFELLAAFAAALFLRLFVVSLARIKGRSMLPTLHDRDVALVWRLGYLLRMPRRGDVVICHYPGRGNTNFVKRVIGIPGDIIEIRDNVVYQNGTAVEESYLTPERNNNGFDMPPFHLGEDEYFVMGDNRDASHDSRNYYSDGTPSAITRNMICGHVRWVAFPFTGIRTID